MFGNNSWPSLVLCPWDGGLLSAFPSFRSSFANCLSRLENRAVGSFVSGRQNHLCFCYLVVFVAHCLLFIQKARAGVLDGAVPLIGCALKVAVSVLLIGHQSATV